MAACIGVTALLCGAIHRPPKRRSTKGIVFRELPVKDRNGQKERKKRDAIERMQPTRAPNAFVSATMALPLSISGFVCGHKYK